MGQEIHQKYYPYGQGSKNNCVAREAVLDLLEIISTQFMFGTL